MNGNNSSGDTPQFSKSRFAILEKLHKLRNWIKLLFLPSVAKRSSASELSKSDDFKEYFKDTFIISQNNISVHFDEKKQIQLHYFIKGEPNTIQCTIGNLIQPFLNSLENDSENAKSKSSLRGVFKIN